jgi:hypothetical protein
MAGMEDMDRDPRIERTGATYQAPARSPLALGLVIVGSLAVAIAMFLLFEGWQRLAIDCACSGNCRNRLPRQPGPIGHVMGELVPVVAGSACLGERRNKTGSGLLASSCTASPHDRTVSHWPHSKGSFKRFKGEEWEMFNSTDEVWHVGERVA